MTNRVARSLLTMICAFAALLALAPLTSMMAQEVPPPQPSGLACATGASEQLLSATPLDDGSQTMALGRLILDPEGGIGAHRNLGTTTVVVESGAFGFTLLDDAEMTITRAATESTDATEESVTVGEEVTLNPGDSYVPPTGAAHAATNRSDESTTVLFAAVFETGQPLEECVDSATPAASPTDSTAGDAPAVDVALSDFTIDMPTEVSAGPTVFHVTNTGDVEHNFEIEGQGIEEEFEENLQPGESATLEVDLQTGTYRVYCPVGNHAAMGMELDLTVSD